MLFTSLIYLSYSFIELYERDVDFVNNVTIALSNKEMIKIKFVDFEKLYNFVVEHFFILINLLLQNMLWSYHLPSVFLSNAKIFLPNVFCPALGKDLIYQVLNFRHLTKHILPSVKKHSAKSLFAECCYFAECFLTALGKEVVCRVLNRMHSANYGTLADSCSGSIEQFKVFALMGRSTISGLVFIGSNSWSRLFLLWTWSSQ